jgi:hypothetical protein
MYKHVNKYINESINKLLRATTNACTSTSKLSKDVLDIEGMSSSKIRHFLNNIIDNDSRYLEIGSWKGSTIISALYKNEFKYVYVIDNWSQYLGPKEECCNNIKKFITNENIIIINENSFTVDFSNLQKINTFFYDGKHDEEAHCNILKIAYPCLDDIFIYIVDDWNWNNVKKDTLKGIMENNLKIKFSMELFSEKNKDIYGWWNGLSMFVLQK